MQTKTQEIVRYQVKAEKLPALDLVRCLCEELNASGVDYCHWKSNAMLDRSARGDNDLDLLVGRGDAQRFANILYRLEFKEVRVSSERQMPGILDYYGCDGEAHRLVHVHAHHQLILGHDATKNYRLPIEGPYLGSAVQRDLFKVPAPEFEFVVFVVRMMLKHSTWDAILGRQGNLSASERQELEYLQSQSSLAQVYRVLNQHLPYVDASLFDECLKSLRPDCPFWTRVRAGQRLKRSLGGYARRSQILDLWLKQWRRLVRSVRRRVFGGVTGKRMANGGVTVAIVGGDGAGKTTAVDELYTWLSEHFEAIKVHMGKPDWSWTTVAVRGILRIGRFLGLYPYVRSPIQYTLDGDSLAFPGYPWLLRRVCTARDRYLTYVRARRFSMNGGLVICDRYPIPKVKLMDGPQVERMTNGLETNWLIRSLAKLENRYYRQIAPPELLVVLRVDPETAVQRKTGEDANYVHARSKEFWEVDWHETHAHILDASRPGTRVLSELKSLIWSEM